MGTHSFVGLAGSALILPAALLLVAPPAVSGQQARDAERGGVREVPTQPVTAPTRPVTAGGGAVGAAALPQRVVPLYTGESRLIDAPWPVKRVSVNNPGVADVDVVSPQQVQLLGIAPGVTDFVMWSEDERVWRARVEVEADLSRLEDQLSKLFPGTDLQVTQVGDVVALNGKLQRSEQAGHLRQWLDQSGLKYLDMTRVAGVQQVQLKVRVAEVSRNALKALGVNTLYLGDDFFGGIQIGSASGPLVPMSVGAAEGALPGSPNFSVAEGGIGVPPAITMFGGFPGADLEVFIQALAENQYLRLLAEPTLVALSGQEASFLAGGEFPVPITELGSGGTTAISIEYREFGVRLNFKPEVLGEGRMRLEVIPEVSELSDVGAVEVQGTRVPSLLTRRVQTTLEVESGQTFGIGGLISSTSNARNSRVPLLGDLPVLGTLFRSVRYSSAETELVILVTASLVEPQSTPIDEIPVPGAGYQPPSAWEFYLLGRIEGETPAKLAPADTERLREMSLDELRGPGAWASYDSPTTGARAATDR